MNSRPALHLTLCLVVAALSGTLGCGDSAGSLAESNRRSYGGGAIDAATDSGSQAASPAADGGERSDAAGKASAGAAAAAQSGSAAAAQSGSGGENNTSAGMNAPPAGTTPVSGGAGAMAGAGSPGSAGQGTAGGSGGASNACTPGERRACYTGPAATLGVGVCRGGSQSCLEDGRAFGACEGEVRPSAAEDCATPEDDDCNGVSVEASAGCVCEPNANTSCYEGPANTQQVGLCRAGMKTCRGDGKAYGPCGGQVLPTAEDCTTSADDDCNGVPNDAGCLCTAGEMRACYSGPPSTQNLGICRGGMQVCNAAGNGFGPCVGEVVPQLETCNVGGDEDCDGTVNESGAGCVCLPNSTRACYSGPPGTQGVGSCVAGVQTCNAEGTAFGACSGEVLPAAAENCATPADDNCNGVAADGCTPPVSFATDVRPILQTHCAPCHTTSGSGGGNFASQYAATQLNSYYCAGQTKGACMLVRIRNGSMPAGAGCTGNPASDLGKAGCFDAAQQAIIEAWIVGGQLP